jgi:hypothetical protein
VPNHEPPAETREPDAPAAVPKATDTQQGEAIPFESSSSAPEADAAREKLRREAQAWGGISDKEIDYILDHHPLATARNMLWRARLKSEPALAS